VGTLTPLVKAIAGFTDNTVVPPGMFAPLTVAPTPILAKSTAVKPDKTARVVAPLVSPVELTPAKADTTVVPGAMPGPLIPMPGVILASSAAVKPEIVAVPMVFVSVAALLNVGTIVATVAPVPTTPAVVEVTGMPTTMLAVDGRSVIVVVPVVLLPVEGKPGSATSVLPARVVIPLPSDSVFPRKSNLPEEVTETTAFAVIW
jgi:hypothetical protein